MFNPITYVNWDFQLWSECIVLATHYKQYLNSIPSDNEWTSISLSRDGNAIAVGRPLSGGGGVTTVYKTRPQRCTGNTKLLRISFTSDDTPEENRWTVHVGNKTIKSQPFDQLQELMTFAEEICVPDNDECIKATRMVTLSTKSLLFEYLVPERVGHSVGTGSTSRVLIRTQTRLKSMMGFSCVSTQGDFGRSCTYDIN